MARILPVLMAIPVTLGFGIVEGLWTNRWTRLPELELAAAKLTEVPLTVGEWDGQAQELEPRQIAVGEIAGYLMRQYVHRRTGKSLSVLLVCGRPGPIAVHPPEVCFGGAGFSVVAPTVKHQVQAESLPKPAEFWTAKFQKLDPTEPEPIRVFWSWTATGEWIASDHPRLNFGRYPTLFKLYVTRSLSNASESLDEDPGLDFLRLFLPEVEKCLWPGMTP